MLENDASLLEKARACLDLELAAVQATRDQLDWRFTNVLRAIAETLLEGHKIIFTGVGKNAHICKKLVGTFNSTGATACYLDAGQALHGDLGLCDEGDLMFLLSNSGETEEILAILPLLRRLGVRSVGMTSVAGSRLATKSDFPLLYVVEKEACPLNLAPTASTTAALALGDALAMVYLEVRGLSREDFARYHPAGSLGKALLLRVSEIMRTGERFAHATRDVAVQEALMAITAAKCGIVALTEPDTGKLAGVFTDGDFRRCALKDSSVMAHPVADYMTPNPKTVPSSALAVDVLKVFEELKINDLIVVDDDDRPVGIIDGQDLPRLRIV